MSTTAEKRSAVFTRVVDAAAVLSVAAYACGFVEQLSETAERCEFVLGGVFVAEIVRRLADARWNVRTFVRHRINVFDTAVIVLATVLPLCAAFLPLIRALPLLRVLRATHLASHARHAALPRVARMSAARRVSRLSRQNIHVE